jgi:hypothetical protein
MGTMNAVQLVLDDHRKIRGLFQQAETVDLRAKNMQLGIIQELLMELEICSLVEQELFYPPYLEIAQTNDRIIANQILANFQIVDNLISELRSVQFVDSRFEEKLRELNETVALLFEEEENMLLPRASHLLHEKLSSLASQMKQRRKELLSSPKYEDSLPEVVQNPNGGEQKRTRKVA